MVPAPARQPRSILGLVHNPNLYVQVLRRIRIPQSARGRKRVRTERGNLATPLPESIPRHWASAR